MIIILNNTIIKGMSSGSMNILKVYRENWVNMVNLLTSAVMKKLKEMKFSKRKQ
jgi:hypothetical protein